MSILPENPITKEYLQEALNTICQLDYSNMHFRFRRSYEDYEHSIRVLLAMFESDENKSGDVKGIIT